MTGAPLTTPPLTDPQQRLLLDVPEQFESERLIIRAPRPGDGAAVNAAIRESLAELRPWMPWADPAPTPDDTEIVMRRSVVNWRLRDDFHLLLWRKSDGEFVGGSGLHRADWSVPMLEIGYWCRTPMSGQGYITEAVRRITEYALATFGAQRIEIRCDALNTRSAAVAERAGYTLEARLRHQMRALDGALRDTLLYATFPDAWGR